MPALPVAGPVALAAPLVPASPVEIRTPRGLSPAAPAVRAGPVGPAVQVVPAVRAVPLVMGQVAPWALADAFVAGRQSRPVPSPLRRLGFEPSPTAVSCSSIRNDTTESNTAGYQ